MAVAVIAVRETVEHRLVERGDGLLERVAADRRAALMKRDAAVLAAVEDADAAAAGRAPGQAGEQVFRLDIAAARVPGPTPESSATGRAFKLGAHTRHTLERLGGYLIAIPIPV